MRILINASNIGFGGASQVTQSICETLSTFKQHFFLVVLSEALYSFKSQIEGYNNIEVVEYSISRSKYTKITGRERFLDHLVKISNIDVVLSVFGPTWWIPKVPHLCGFALAHIVMSDSPYFSRMSMIERVKSRINIYLMRCFYKRSSMNYYTENPMISESLKKIFKQHSIYTVTNFYHQVFEDKTRWRPIELPYFKGKTFITLASAYPHKNLQISIDIAKYLKANYPKFSFRFLFSIDRNQFAELPNELEDHFLFIGSVPIEVCPFLYKQSDVVFQPTLLECFTAAYPEAMVMERPIVTTNLPFAKGLCGDAALYYSALSPAEAAECLYAVSTNKDLADQLVKNGKQQLVQYDDYMQRARKLIAICEKIYIESKII